MEWVASQRQICIAGQASSIASCRLPGRASLKVRQAALREAPAEVERAVSF